MITLSKIAKLAHVSVSTVSKALNHSNHVDENTKKLVFSVAEKYGYFTQKKQRHLETKRNPVMHVAVLCPEIVSSHYSAVTTSIYRNLERQNINCEVHIFDHNPENEIRLIKELYEAERINGIISLSSANDSPLPFKFPIVKQGLTQNFSCAYCKSDKMIRCAYEHLHSLGHTRVGFLSENLTGEKAERFIDLLKEHDIKQPERMLFHSGLRFEECGYDSVARAIKSGKKLPTAFIAAYDEIAFGAIRALSEFGYQVPRDISIVGINNVPASAYTQTPLTTISMDTEALSIQLIELLLEQFKNPDAEIKQIEYETRLVLRNTTTNPPNKNFRR